jgi:hypothetical protein
MLPSSSESKNKPSSTCYLLQDDFLLGSLFDPEDEGDMFLRNVGWLSNGLHGVIFQMIALFIST